MLLQVQGETAYCYTGGKAFDPALPALIFLHGAQNDHSVWGLQSRYFAHHGYAVLAPDLPAHGRSSGKPLTSVQAMRDWVLAVMDAAGVEKASVIGHSMGALVALDIAAAAPERVQRLAMLGVAWPMKVSTSLLDASLNEVPRAITMVNVWQHSSYAAKPSAPGPGFWLHGMAQRLMERIDTNSEDPVFHTDFTACDSYADGGQAAAKVRCPTLFILGSADQMTPPKAAAKLCAALPEARVLRLPCGHQMMTESPDQVRDGLQDFLSS
jgi:pimeloyl-ACP methyl ester carboxylesterase